MRPKERRDSGQKDLFRARLDQIIDMGHPLAKLARTVMNYAHWRTWSCSPLSRAKSAMVRRDVSCRDSSAGRRLTAIAGLIS
jgi:hypothetical protein